MTIKQQQDLLDYLGYPLANDGIDGPKTQAALAAFRADYGQGPEALPGAVAGTVPPISGTAADGWSNIRHFRREEFRCKCGGQYCNGWPAEPQIGMVQIAEAIRVHFEKPATVVSGLRCPTWNAMQGGVENSQHMFGEACDISVAETSWEKVLEYVQSLPCVRYAYHIKGSNNVHFDIPAGDR